MNNENKKVSHEDFNPDMYEAIPEELLANDEEQGMTYADEEETVTTASQFLNIEGAEFGHKVFKSIKDGNIDPMIALIMIKKMQHLHDYFLGSDKARTNKEAKEYLRDKVASIVGKEEWRAYGASVKMQAIGGGHSMDYSECGDLVLDKLMEIQAEVVTLVKERREYIKNNLPAESNIIGLRSHTMTMDKFPSLAWADIEEQEYKINPPIKYSREGIVVRFPKKR